MNKLKFYFILQHIKRNLRCLDSESSLESSFLIVEQTFIMMVIFHYIIAIAVYRATFGRGTGPVLLTHVNCTGTESSLLSCSREGTNLRQCSHYGSYYTTFEDAGVVCPCKLDTSHFCCHSGKCVSYCGHYDKCWSSVPNVVGTKTECIRSLVSTIKCPLDPSLYMCTPKVFT